MPSPPLAPAPHIITEQLHVAPGRELVHPQAVGCRFLLSCWICVHAGIRALSTGLAPQAAAGQNLFIPNPPQESGQGGNFTQNPQAGGDEGKKAALCLWVPQNLIMKGIGEGFHPKISLVDDLCQMLGGLQNLPATLEHKHREGSETPPRSTAGGQEFGSQQERQGHRGRRGRRGTSSSTCSFR